jgi:hypothetical protein
VNYFGANVNIINLKSVDCVDPNLSPKTKKIGRFMEKTQRLSISCGDDFYLNQICCTANVIALEQVSSV